jgi:hypothetical protein
MLSCLKSVFCLRFLQGNNYPDVIVAHRPEVTLDTSRMGQDVVVVKNGRRLCGTGAAVAVNYFSFLYFYRKSSCFRMHQSYKIKHILKLNYRHKVR